MDLFWNRDVGVVAGERLGRFFEQIDLFRAPHNCSLKLEVTISFHMTDLVTMPIGGRVGRA